MDALGAKKYGPYKDVLELIHFPQVPKCEESNDVLIKINYSDVNPVDLQKNYGKTNASLGQAIPNGPLIPGYGGSGYVLEVGSNVSQTLVGKDVVFIADPTRHGSYATHILVNKHCVAEIPSSSKVNLRDAACIPVAGLTAYECLNKLGLAKNNISIDSTTGTLSMVGLTTGGGLNTTNPDGDAAGNKISSTTSTSAIGTSKEPSLLVIGGSGGVGSWILTLVHAWHPHYKLYATASAKESKEWCKLLGADTVVGHNELEETFAKNSSSFNDKDGCIDTIICLTEPTTPLMTTMSKLIRPYGQIVFVVSGKSIESIDLSFCFFKCVNIYTQTVFTSIRTNYKQIIPKDELKVLLNLLSNQIIEAPIYLNSTSTRLLSTNDNNNIDNSNSLNISEKFSDAMKPNIGLLSIIDPYISHPQYPKRGNVVMFIASGDDLIFLDLKTASIITLPRKDCIEKKYLRPVSNNDDDNNNSNDGKTPTRRNNKRTSMLNNAETTMYWEEQAISKSERDELIKKITSHTKLGIIKMTEKQCKDALEELQLEEAENVKNLWGVSLKKRREKNVKGEEFIFVDPRLCIIGELSRKVSIEKGLITIEKSKNKKEGEEKEEKETIVEAITDSDEHEAAAQMVRESFQLHLGPAL